MGVFIDDCTVEEAEENRDAFLSANNDTPKNERNKKIINQPGSNPRHKPREK